MPKIISAAQNSNFVKRVDDFLSGLGPGLSQGGLMEQQIINALNAIHLKLQGQTGINIQYIPTTLATILEELGFPRNSIPVGFHDALENLQARGVISDLSNSNYGFGRNKGTDGDIAYSNGAKVVLL